MATFEQFLPQLLRFEGGFVDDPDDPGGATNKGITMRTFAGSARSLLGIDPTLENLKALTDAQAGVIYKALYWDRIDGDQIALQPLASIVCDFYVNAGGHAVKTLQGVLNAMGAAPLLPVDGAFGPGTLHALMGADQTEVYRRYKQGRIAYYQALVASRPPLGKFLGGWLNRVRAFPDL